jgi:hypothetical protein
MWGLWWAEWQCDVLSSKYFFFFFVIVIPAVLHTHTDSSAMSTVLCLWCPTSGISVIQYDAQNTELWVYVMVCHGVYYMATIYILVCCTSNWAFNSAVTATGICH